MDDYQQLKQSELDKLIHERQRCYYHRMKATSEEEKGVWSAKAKQFTPAIKKLEWKSKPAITFEIEALKMMLNVSHGRK